MDSIETMKIKQRNTMVRLLEHVNNLLTQPLGNENEDYLTTSQIFKFKKAFESLRAMNGVILHHPDFHKKILDY